MRRQLVLVFFAHATAFAVGFFKFWLVARLFGVGVELDGYYLALTLPTFISGVASGLLQTGFFTVRARLARVSTPVVVECFERTVLVGNALVGALIALVLALIVFTIPAVMGVDTQSNTWQNTAYVLPYALALIPLNALGGAMGYLLAFRGCYHWFAAAPIANALFSSGLLLAWPEGGLFNLALGTLLGLALQVGLCAWALQRGGFRFIGVLARIGEMTQEWREMLRLSTWILPGILLANLSATLPTVLMASHGEGAVSVFGYAWRLHTYAVQLLVMGMASVILARFSGLVAQGDLSAVRSILDKAFWISVLIGIAAVGGVWLAGVPVLEFVFGGRFDAAASRAVAGQWQWLALALGPVILGNVLAKFFQACGNVRILNLFAVIGFCTLLMVTMLAGSMVGAHAVSIAVAVSAFAIAIVGWRKMNDFMREEAFRNET
jgi:peptidoglycan biosynthesis protein MviN/MurJ (putative lipid II flippase)